MGREQLRESYRTVFESPQGQRVLWHIANSGYVGKSTFVRGDIHETILREGQRRLALSILRYVYRTEAELQAKTRSILSENHEERADDAG